jgi:hypothetical protein
MHLPVRLRVPLAGLALLSAALLVSACGGSDAADKTTAAATTDASKVPANAIALVGAETVSRAKLQDLMTQLCKQYKASKKACPKAGSKEFKEARQGFVAQLVQQAEFEAAAKKLNVSVKQKDATAALQKLKLQYAKAADGTVDEGKWKKVLADNNTTQAAVVGNLHDGLLRQAIYASLTKAVAVKDADIAAYYAKNKKNYATPATRVVRHILVKDKKLADQIYAQLATSDAQFAALAKKYTIDPGSKKNGGQLGKIQKGQTVPAFDKVAFAAPTGKVAKPVKSAYGWHVIEATGATAAATQKPLDAKLKSTIRTTLLNEKKQSVANKWFISFQKTIEKDLRYAAGFAPPKTTSTATATTATAAQ